MVDPFARSLTRQTACKAPSHPGCGKIGRSWRCAPWHRSPSYDLRRAPYDRPDFNSNALSEDLFSGSLNKQHLHAQQAGQSARLLLSREPGSEARSKAGTNLVEIPAAAQAKIFHFQLSTTIYGF